MTSFDVRIERWCSIEEGQFFERKSALKRPDGGRRGRRPAADVARDVVELAAIKEARQRRPAEGRFVLTASMRDIDRESLAAFRQRVGHSGSDEEVLARYRLAESRNGGVALTLGGLLLFGREPGRWHPRCGVDFVKYEGTERGVGDRLNIVHRRRIEAPLPALIDQTFAAIVPHVRERQRLVDLFFEERLEYPTFAWQEAIVNAVAHRDYSYDGVGIEISMFDDRLEIRSPGAPIEPVTVDRLRGLERVHASRNPRISRVLTELGLMRELGEGIPRMYQEMGRAGLYPPELAVEADSFFKVTLRNVPIFSVATERWLARFEMLGLSVNQRRLLSYAREHDGRFTSRAYQDLIGTDITAAQRDIRSLIGKGLVQRTAKHGKVYQLAVDLSMEPESEAPDSLRPLIDLLRDDGHIANADVQRHLGVNRKQAGSMLRQWHEAGWLQKSGARRWTRYSAGPRLPL